MKDTEIDSDRLDAILNYLIEHSEGHREEDEKWLRGVEKFGDEEITRKIQKVVKLTGTITRLLREARAILHGQREQPYTGETHRHGHDEESSHGVPHRHIQFHQIGTIHTPYTPGTSSSEMMRSDTPCSIILDENHREGLWKLDSFSHIIVLYYLDRVTDEPALTVSPPWAGGVKTGLFASRSPNRPNPIGLSLVPLWKITGNVIYTGNIDAFDGTPLLDIKPYLEAVESREGAGNGWIDELDDVVKSKAFEDPSK
jgi:tRNA-Thr(GGU) m(6)t(6)A37 methyltransferase TsaA